MDRDPGAEATRLLHALGAGDGSAAEPLLALVHAELRGIAGGLMRDERADHTLQATALVNEAWIRLVRGGGSAAEDRKHFLRLAARAMRQVLIDHARARGRDKRGGGKTLLGIDQAADAWDAWQDDRVDVLALGEALERLETEDAELARVVELRFFAGLTLAETADALDTTLEGVRWAWKLARAWLRRELERGEA